MLHRHWIAIALAAICCSWTPTLRAQSGDAVSPRYEGQIFNDGDLLLVDVLGNGRTYRFVVDTGASHTVVDAVTFKDLISANAEESVIELANGGARVRKFRNPQNLLVGGKLPIKSSHLGAISLASFSALHGAQLDGILGCDFLREYVIEFNFDRARIVFREDSAKLAGAAERLWGDKFNRPRVVISQPNLRADLSDSKYYLIDTGAFGVQDLVLNRACFQEAVETELLSLEDSGPGVDISGLVRRRKGFLKEFNLWGDSSRKLRVVENASDSSNQLALQYLIRFNLTVDFPNSKVYVQRRKSPQSEIDWKDKSGLTLMRYGGNLVVDEVQPDSPASNSRIRRDDIVLSINSVPESKYRLLPLRRLLCEDGKSVRLDLKRQAKEWSVELELRDYRKPVTEADFE